MKPHLFAIPRAEVEIIEKSLMRVVAVDDAVTFRSGLPEERWPRPTVAIVERRFSSPRAFHHEQRQQEQKQRALIYVLQHRGMA